MLAMVVLKQKLDVLTRSRNQARVEKEKGKMVSILNFMSVTL